LRRLPRRFIGGPSLGGIIPSPWGAVKPATKSSRPAGVIRRACRGQGEGSGLVPGEAEPGALVEVVGLTDVHGLVVVGHVVLGVGAVEAVAPVLVREAVGGAE